MVALNVKKKTARTKMARAANIKQTINLNNPESSQLYYFQPPPRAR